jgi:hypothetical protein
VLRDHQTRKTKVLFKKMNKKVMLKLFRIMRIFKVKLSFRRKTKLMQVHYFQREKKLEKKKIIYIKVKNL